MLESDAEYLHEYSTFSDVSHSVLALRAVIHYLTQQYFPAICNDGQHILSSIPVWKSVKTAPSYALTSVGFHVSLGFTAW